MLYRTHIASSLALGTALIVVSDFPFSIGYVAGVVLGSLLPDIDEPNSYIGQRSFGLAHLVKKRFGHRGMTHSLLCWLGISIICLFFSNPFTLGISIGYFFHLLGDLFSISGIPLFAPFKKDKIKMWLRYRTGGVIEQIIFSASIILFLYLCLKEKRLMLEFWHSIEVLFTEIVTILKSVLMLM